MTEADWLSCADPWPMLDFIRRRATPRKLRLFSCGCVRYTPLGDGRRIWDLLTDSRSQQSVEAAERFADDLISHAEMEAARTAAHKFADELRDVALYAAASPSRTHIISSAGFSVRNAIVTVVNRGTPQDRYDDADIAAGSVCHFFRDVLGTLPFRSIPFDFAWSSPDVQQVANSMYESRYFAAMPILGDALEDAGCTNAEMLGHCRAPGPHVRGCWVVDLVLGKELQPLDVQLDLLRLPDNRRLLRASHRPTGICTEGIRTRAERMWALKVRLMKELVRRVWMLRSQNAECRTQK